MDDLFKISEKKEEIDLSVMMQKVYYYSNELEKLRKNGIVMDTFQYEWKRETIAVEDGSGPSFCAFGIMPV